MIDVKLPEKGGNHQWKKDILPAAQQAGADPHFSDIARKQVMHKAIALAAQHRKSGAFMDAIKMKKIPGRRGRGVRVQDRYVYTDDPRAASKEFGHLQGPKGEPGRERVAGQGIFTEVLARARDLGR